MAAKSIIAIVLIVLGVTGLLYGGFSYTRDKTVVDLGPIEVTKHERERVPLPPVVGGVLLVSGVALLLFARKGSAV